MTREKVANFLTYLCLFLLPWQTVWIYDSVGGGEYQKMTHYAVQFLVVLAIVIRWKIKTQKKNKKIIRATWWFYGAVLFSCIFSVSPYLSFGFSFHILFAILLFWLLLDERLESKKIIWFFVLGLIVPCLLGWWQVLVGASPASTIFGLAEHLVSTSGTSVVETVDSRLMRAYGTFPHPNIFGGYLVASLMMILARMTASGRMAIHPYDQSRYAVVIRTIILFFLSSTLVVTFSRSAWLALIVGVIFFFVVSAITRKKISRNFLKGLAVAFIAIVASVALFHNAVFTRISATDRLETKSLSERQSEYQMISEVIKINPFIGVGAGSYIVALSQKFPNHEIWFYQPMHNSFLLIFAETGLLGILFAGWFLLIIVKNYFFTPPLHHSPPSLGSGGPAEALAKAGITLPLLFSLATLALFDHYLWSQWAGLSLVVVVFVLVLKTSIDQSCQSA